MQWFWVQFTFEVICYFHYSRSGRWTTALSWAIQMDGTWWTELIITRFPLPSLIYVGSWVKQIIQLNNFHNSKYTKTRFRSSVSSQVKLKPKHITRWYDGLLVASLFSWQRLMRWASWRWMIPSDIVYNIVEHLVNGSIFVKLLYRVMSIWAKWFNKDIECYILF